MKAWVRQVDNSQSKKGKGKREDGERRRSHQPLRMRDALFHASFFTFTFCLFTFAFTKGRASASKQSANSEVAALPFERLPLPLSSRV
jgi:hypothetical protein